MFRIIDYEVRPRDAQWSDRLPDFPEETYDLGEGYRAKVSRVHALGFEQADSADEIELEAAVKVEKKEEHEIGFWKPYLDIDVDVEESEDERYGFSIDCSIDIGAERKEVEWESWSTVIPAGFRDKQRNTMASIHTEGREEFDRKHPRLRRFGTGFEGEYSPVEKSKLNEAYRKAQESLKPLYDELLESKDELKRVGNK